MQRPDAGFRLFEVASLLAAVLFLYSILSPILKPDLLAGWDISSHYLLTVRMAEYLGHGRVTGYDPTQFAGFPAFSVYPPLAYVVPALAHLSFPSALPLELAFNGCVFLLPFMLLFAMYLSGRLLFGRGAALGALAAGVLFLVLPGEFAPAGLGLKGLLQTGYYSNFFALPFFLLYLCALQLIDRAPSWKLTLVGGLLLALIVFTHQLTAVFAFWSGCCAFVICSKHARVKILCALALGILLSAVWWVPSLPYLPYGSGRAQDYSLELFSPMRSLSAGWRLTLWEQFRGLTELALSGGFAGFWYRSGLVLHEFVSIFPWASTGLVIFALIGGFSLVRARRYFLPALFLFSTLFVSLSTSISRLGPAIYYFRFSQFIMILSALMAAIGISRCAAACWERKGSLIPGFYRVQAGLLFSLPLCFACFAQFDVHQYARSSRTLGHDFRFFLNEYPQYEQVENLFQAMQKLGIRGRLAEELPPDSWIESGTWRIFSALGPLKYGVSSITGMLIESSLTPGFTEPVLAYLSRHFLWARNRLANIELMRKGGTPAMIERLREYRVQYVISESREYAEALRKVPQDLLVPRGQFGDFGLFEIQQIPELVEYTAYQPLYWWPLAGQNFREISEEWFSNIELLKFPLVYANKPFRDLPATDRDQMGGLAVFIPKGSSMDERQLSEWRAAGKKVFLFGEAPQDQAFPDSVISFTSIGDAGLPSVLDLDLKIQEPNAKGPELRESLRAGDFQLQISGRSGMKVRYSFDPGWKIDSEHPIYWMAPSLIYVVGSDQNMVLYH